MKSFRRFDATWSYPEGHLFMKDVISLMLVSKPHSSSSSHCVPTLSMKYIHVLHLFEEVSIHSTFQIHYR